MNEGFARLFFWVFLALLIFLIAIAIRKQSVAKAIVFGTNTSE
jgi:hypothetical protein